MKTYIAMNQEHLLEKLKLALENTETFQVIGTTTDETECLNFITSHDCDLLIMDPMLLEFDGQDIIEKIKEMKNAVPHMIISSSTDHSMYKTINESSLNHSKALCYLKYRQDLDTEISKLLHEIGIPAHIKGYTYLRHAIRLVYEDSDHLKKVTTVLYPYIAKAYNSTPTRVERDIRHAIEVGWDRGDIDVIYDIFGYSVSFEKSRPTNTEFIAMISDVLRLKHYRKT